MSRRPTAARLFKEAVASQGESIRSQLAVFLHDKHERTSDPLDDPREMNGAGQSWRLAPLLLSSAGKVASLG
jgi:hypothetical protein